MSALQPLGHNPQVNGAGDYPAQQINQNSVRFHENKISQLPDGSRPAAGNKDSRNFLQKLWHYFFGNPSNQEHSIKLPSVPEGVETGSNYVAKIAKDAENAVKAENATKAENAAITNNAARDFLANVSGNPSQAYESLVTLQEAVKRSDEPGLTAKDILQKSVQDQNFDPISMPNFTESYNLILAEHLDRSFNIMVTNPASMQAAAEDQAELFDLITSTFAVLPKEDVEIPADEYGSEYPISNTQGQESDDGYEDLGLGQDLYADENDIELDDSDDVDEQIVKDIDNAFDPAVMDKLIVGENVSQDLYWTQHETLEGYENPALSETLRGDETLALPETPEGHETIGAKPSIFEPDNNNVDEDAIDQALNQGEDFEVINEADDIGLTPSLGLNTN